MATTDSKKFVSLARLDYYDEKLKKVISDGDAATLASAQSYADGLATNYDAAGSAAGVQAKLDTEVARAKAKEDEIAAAAAKAQGEVDALELLVGTLPEGASATTVVGYVDAKTSGIASDETVNALAGRVETAEGAIDAIEADYLKAADKTALQDAINAEVARADAAEKLNAGKIATIEADYLKDADKTELQGNIDVVGGKVNTLVGEDADKSVRTIANEELAKQLIAEGAAESLDTLKEIADWIQAHPGDASEMNSAIAALEALVGEIPEGVTATTVAGYIAEVVAAEKTRAEGAEADLAERIDAIDAKFGEGEGSVSDLIGDAIATEAERVNAAIAEVQTDADKGISDAAAALAAAQAASAHADELNTAMAARMTEVEAKKHEHTNKAELDLVKSGDVAKWDGMQAAAEATAAANLASAVATLEGKITAAQQAAEKVANDNNTAMDARVKTLETWHEEFVEVTNSEIDQLFQ